MGGPRFWQERLNETRWRASVCGWTDGWLTIEAKNDCDTLTRMEFENARTPSVWGKFVHCRTALMAGPEGGCCRCACSIDAQ